jgi:tetratricopeptide (TPR) repeat protein
VTSLTPGDPFALVSDTGAGGFVAGEHADAGGVLASDRLFGGRWSIRAVHHGGMGEVYICDSTGEPPLHAALKSFKRSAFFTASAHRAFLREMLLWSRLSGIPCVMPVLDVEHHDGRPFIVMPAVPPGPAGEVTLADLIQARSLEGSEALQFAWQLAGALDAVAKRVPGLVHGDIKPSNLLIWHSNLYVSDFGLARAAHDSVAAEMPLGTPGYRAPELDDPDHAATVATDVYAAGVVIEEIARRSAGPLAVALSEVARVCTAESAAARPQDFAALVERLGDIAAAFGVHVGRRFDEVMDDPDLLHLHQALAINGWRAALRAGEHDVVLDDIEVIQEEKRSPQTWIYHGGALSLAGRDQEALVSQTRALTFPLSEADRDRVQMEIALSLRRLGQYDEAEAMLRELMRTAGGEQLSGVVINLAGLYLERGKPDAAAGLLERHLSAHPEAPYQARMQLGFSRRDAGDFELARRAFRDAVSHAPAVPAAHAALARLLMDDIGDFAAAAESVGFALSTGDVSEEMLLRGLVCARLLDDIRMLESILEVAEQLVGAEAVALLLRESDRLIEGAVPPPARPAADEAAEGAARPSLDDWAVTHGGPLPDSHLAGEGPFAQLAIGMDGFYSIDYDEVGDPRYIDELFGWIASFEADMAASEQGATLRANPFVFVRCPTCSTEIVTNRRFERESFGCRRCGQRVPLTPLQRPDLDALVEAIATRRGHGAGGTACDLIVVVQPVSDDVSLSVIEDVAQAAGFTLLPHGDLRLVMTAVQASVRAAVELERPYCGVILRVDATTDDLPLAALAEELVSRVRREVGSVNSLSFQLSIAESETLVALQSGDVDEIERDLRARPRDAETVQTWLMFAHMSMQAGQLANALRQAETAVRIAPDLAMGWRQLGAVQSRMNHPEAALESLLRARQLDPAHPTVYRLLVECYVALGNDEEAQAAARRAEALGADLRDVYRPT